ncbi:MAG: Ribosome-binding factor A [Candidatus Omnitrophica bacterium ADurb.Bin205]|nr:MAG: Ribosome-binding factor A [Candidatus Omnitrophica bacterium ADurb.Bin205]
MSRQDKVAEAIRQEVSVIIHDKLKDPRVGFVTITNVEITHDLRFAKIFFSVLGNEEAYKKTKLAFDSSLGFIRKLIAQRLNLRFAPEIAFYEDRSSEYSVRIEEILNQIKEHNEQDKPKKGFRSNKKT